MKRDVILLFVPLLCFIHATSFVSSMLPINPIYCLLSVYPLKPMWTNRHLAVCLTIHIAAVVLMSLDGGNMWYVCEQQDDRRHMDMGSTDWVETRETCVSSKMTGDTSTGVPSTNVPIDVAYVTWTWVPLTGWKHVKHVWATRWHKQRHNNSHVYHLATIRIAISTLLSLN